MSKHGHIHIGTSGWHYKHWIGTFYPADISESQQLGEYLRYFRTVELNNSFYRLPSRSVFAGWAAAVPAGFLFSVKASRYITHMKKLKTDRASVMRFLDRAAALKHKLGPVLFQLPPHWQVNPDRLKDFLSKLPDRQRFVFEFRDESWYDDAVYSILKEHNCACCIYELAGYTSPEAMTADFIYVRLHGPGDKYQGSYTRAQLRRWAKRLLQWAGSGLDVFLYFDNDEAGYAAFNAQTLQGIIDNKLKTS